MAGKYHNRIARNNAAGVVGHRHDVALSTIKEQARHNGEWTEFDEHMTGPVPVRNEPANENAGPSKPAFLYSVGDAPLLEEPAGERGMAGQFTDPDVCMHYMLAGSATITIVGQTTRYTYKVTMKHEDQSRPPVWFVALLAGPDNESDFQYLGMINHGRFNATRASRMREGSKPFDAFKCVWHWLVDLHRMPSNAQLWHEGRCGRCNRKLTVPTSIATGFGPECAGKVGWPLL